MLDLKHVYQTFNAGTSNEKKALIDLNLHIDDGDFITVIGGNGAGKSTLLNVIAGVYRNEMGKIILDDIDLTNLPEYKRASYIGRVFQDPMMGTASDMTIEENMALAARRGRRRGLKWEFNTAYFWRFIEAIYMLDLMLENSYKTKMGLLSGGQRQAITLLMATIESPKLLLLDEHTAALDPKTASKVLEITDNIVQERQLTTIMITHNMRDAIKMGNRLIMMNQGRIIYDVSGEEKKQLKTSDLLARFELATGEEFADDRALLN